MKLTERDIKLIDKLSAKEIKIQSRLNESLKASGLSIPSVAKHFNINKSPCYRWFYVKVPSNRISGLANLFKVDFLWLSCEDEFKVTEKIPAYDVKAWHGKGDLTENDILIPVYDVALSAGNGVINPEYVETKHKLPFSLNWINKKGLIVNDLKLMKVKGDSMHPVLNDDDMVLINTAKRDIVDGKIYAIVIGQEAKIKRLKRSFDGSLTIMSDNPAPMYQDEIITADNMQYVYIIGLAVHRSGDI